MAVMRTSIHGRRLGLSSTGGLIVTPATGSTQAEGHGGLVQLWGPDHTLTPTPSSAFTIPNSGVTIVSTDSTSGAILTIAAPVAGVYKEIHFQTSATALTLTTSATTIYFNSTLAEGASRGSTTISIAGAAAGIGGSLVLRGLSTTVWGIVSNIAGASS